MSLNNKLPSWVGKQLVNSPRRIGTMVDSDGVERGVYEVKPVLWSNNKNSTLAILELGKLPEENRQEGGENNLEIIEEKTYKTPEDFWK